MTSKTEDFWNKRYRDGLTGWDIGYASPAILNYCKELPINTRILIPGAGNAHEWVALRSIGFSDITVLDISHRPIDRLKKEHPQWADDLHIGDFFDHEGEYDLILEQTFFCAINPSLRKQYLTKMMSLLRPEGKLAGLLFDRTFEKEGPPFGGSRSEYIDIFNTKFKIISLSPCQESIPERAGTELFLEASLQ